MKLLCPLREIVARSVLLVSAVFATTVCRVWAELPSGLRLQLQHRDECIHDLAFSADRRLAVTVGNDSGQGTSDRTVIRLWSCQSNSVLWRTVVPSRVAPAVSAQALGFAADGRVVVCIRERESYYDQETNDCRVAIFELHSGKQLSEHTISRDAPTQLSRDRKLVALEDTQTSRGRMIKSLALADGSLCEVTSEDYVQEGLLSKGVYTPPTPGGSPRSLWYELKNDILSAHEAGAQLWQRDFRHPDGSGSLQPVQGDERTRWLVWYDQRIKKMEVLDAASGRTIFVTDALAGIPRLFAGGDERELWMATAPWNFEGFEDTAGTSSLWRIRLDGSNQSFALPMEGFLRRPEHAILAEDRYVVAVSTMPAAAWCWDLQTLGLLWMHDDIPASPDGVEVSYRGGVVRLQAEGNGRFRRHHSFRVEDGKPIWEEPERALERSDATTRSPSTLSGAAIRHLQIAGITVQSPEYGRVRLPDGDLVTCNESLLARTIPLAVFLTSEGLRAVNLRSGYAVNLVALRTREDHSNWMAYDKDGHFDASSEGGRLLALVSGLEAHPVEQFAVELNRPDVLLRGLGTGAPPTLECFQQEHEYRRRKADSTTALSAASLPEVRLLESMEINGSQRLKLRLLGNGSRVASYQVFVNDVPLYGRIGRELPEPTEDGELEDTIKLGPGQNKIEVSCFNTGNMESARVVTFALGRKTPVASLYYLGIGVSDYVDPALPDLSFAHQDAIDLSGIFSQMQGKGYTRAEVRTVVNEVATLSGIREALSFLQKADTDDTVVLFISGHGCQDKDGYFYLPHDASLKALAETAVPFHLLEDALLSCKARTKLVLMDTCASGERRSDSAGAATVRSGKGLKARTFGPITGDGAVSAGGFLPADANGGWLGDRFSTSDLFRRTGAVVISSCTGDEQSLEGEDVANGLFTEAILEAFRLGRGDLNSDGMVSKTELLGYTRSRVAELIHSVEEDARLTQTPVIDRDNLWEPMMLPVLARAESEGVGGSFVRVTAGSALVWWDKADSRASLNWNGKADADGFAHGTGFLTRNRSSSAKENYHGRMTHGRLDGPVTITEMQDTTHGRTMDTWWESGRKIHEVVTDEPAPAPPPNTPLNIAPSQMPPRQKPVPIRPTPQTDITMAVPGGQSGYMLTVQGVFVWNNVPMADDRAVWEGGVDPQGFASGTGTLNWFKGNIFVTAYVGTMVRGRLEGQSLSVDASGVRSGVWWRDGKKVARR